MSLLIGWEDYEYLVQALCSPLQADCMVTETMSYSGAERTKSHTFSFLIN